MARFGLSPGTQDPILFSFGGVEFAAGSLKIFTDFNPAMFALSH